MRSAFESALTPTAPTQTEDTSSTHPIERDPSTFEPVGPPNNGLTPQLQTDPNPFVPYLNSLHSRSAETDNALAEAQARNPFFTFIHVTHPLVRTIEGLLTATIKRHVIVTGHAGDGKSTIAVELIKRFRGLAVNQPLQDPLKRREEIVAQGVSISLIKDFSEWSPADRRNLLEEMLIPDGKRFCLISNTGTLLDTLRAREQGFNEDWVGVESGLLAAMGTTQGGTVELHGATFLPLEHGHD